MQMYSLGLEGPGAAGWGLNGKCLLETRVLNIWPPACAVILGSSGNSRRWNPAKQSGSLRPAREVLFQPHSMSQVSSSCLPRGFSLPPPQGPITQGFPMESFLLLRQLCQVLWHSDTKVTNTYSLSFSPGLSSVKSYSNTPSKCLQLMLNPLNIK